MWFVMSDKLRCDGRAKVDCRLGSAREEMCIGSCVYSGETFQNAKNQGITAKVLLK